MKRNFLVIAALNLCVSAAMAQVNSGSNGSDGAFNPTRDTVINMADRPDGIYHYTSVNIPAIVTVTFIPNANNTPVVWLVQSSVVINGTVDVSGHDPSGSPRDLIGTDGGPGGFRGGHGGDGGSAGLGPGSGVEMAAAFGTFPQMRGGGGPYEYFTNGLVTTYGNQYQVPLIGGSGGGGVGAGQNADTYAGGGGGGGALLIAASQVIELNGRIAANGGHGGFNARTAYAGGGGSGGAVRLMAQKIQGGGTIHVYGGTGPSDASMRGGFGRVRLDAFEHNFGGTISGAFTRGYQPIVLQTSGRGAQLTVASVGGVSVSASPSGQLLTPDAVLPAQQNNPIPIVVHCSNIPLNTSITVSVRPANGAAVSATGINNSGTLSSSTATVLINMPRGGGIIYATAAN